MKKLSILFLVLISTILVSCDKDSYGDMYGEGESLPPYVTITAKTPLTAIEGTTATIAISMRTAIQEPVTVTYSVSGAFTFTGTVTIPRNATTVNAVVTIPPTLVPATAASASATFTLTGAKTATTATALTLGQFGAATETRPISIVKNLVKFTGTDVTVAETVDDQTIDVPLAFGAALKANTTITYSIASATGNTSHNLTMVTPASVVVPAGSTTATLKIKVSDDVVINDANEYTVQIVSSTASTGAEVYVDAANSAYTVTVTDDLKSVSFASSAAVNVAAMGNVNLAVNLSAPKSTTAAPSPTTIAVPFTITGGVAGVDYIVRSVNPIVFGAGSTTSNVNIDIPSGYTPGTVLKVTLGTLVTTDGEASVGPNNVATINLK